MKVRMAEELSSSESSAAAATMATSSSESSFGIGILRRHLWQRCSRGHRWRSKRRCECQRRRKEGKGECGRQTRACACGWRR
uniref:Uncharacterized protein n=1 Tax=Fagus sylvatica TaxID=28930 RepID=A0A2N9ITB2_FAGSY